jgi:hypothetical protein
MNIPFVAPLFVRRCLSALGIGVLFLLCFVSQISAQVYGTVSAGYSLGFPSVFLGNETDNPRAGVYDALAKGFSLGAGVGYTITPTVGVELMFSYLAGDRTSEFGDVPTTYSLSMPVLMPRAVLSIPLSSINLYTKIGPYLALPSLKERMRSTPHFIITDIHGNNLDEYISFYKGGLALGYCSSAGMSVVKGNTTLFIEASFVSAGWGPNRREDNTGERIADYRERFEERDKFTTSLQPRFNLGSIGLQAGVQFHF